MNVRQLDKRFFGRQGDAEDIVVAKSAASYLTDSRGRNYIDFMMGWCVGNLGWGNTEIRAAARKFDDAAATEPSSSSALRSRMKSTPLKSVTPVARTASLSPPRTTSSCSSQANHHASDGRARARYPGEVHSGHRSPTWTLRSDVRHEQGQARKGRLAGRLPRERQATRTAKPRRNDNS
jgi:hypothetical protein